MAFRGVTGDDLSKVCSRLSGRARSLALRHSWKSEQARPPAPPMARSSGFPPTLVGRLIRTLCGAPNRRGYHEIDVTARGFGGSSSKDEDRYFPDQRVGTRKEARAHGVT